MFNRSGPLSEYLHANLAKSPFRLRNWPSPTDDEVQYCLYLVNEFNYAGLGNSINLDWQIYLHDLRVELEDHLLHELDCRVKISDSLDECLVSSAPSLSKWLLETDDVDKFVNYVIQRSCYQLKEADPHMMGVLRFPASIKQKLLEIQVGEYFPIPHSVLWAELMQEMGLNTELNGYLAEFSDITLKLMNLMSLFAFNLNFSNELMGHLAAMELTSVPPMSNYAEFAKRHNWPTKFFDVHVWADQQHGPMAKALCNELDASKVNFGARALIILEEDFSQSIMGG